MPSQSDDPLDWALRTSIQAAAASDAIDLDLQRIAEVGAYQRYMTEATFRIRVDGVALGPRPDRDVQRQ